MSVSKEISLTNLLSTSQSVLPLVLLQLSLAPQNLQEKLTISLGITLSLSLRLYTSSINADAVFCYLAVFRGIDFRFFLVWSSCDDLYEASSLCLRDIKRKEKNICLIKYWTKWGVIINSHKEPKREFVSILLTSLVHTVTAHSKSNLNQGHLLRIFSARARTF